MKSMFYALAVFCGLCLAASFSGCVPSSPTGGAASQSANAQADQEMYQEVQYVNANKQGPQLVVLPGQIKSSNATFSQKITTNNIADFAEIELSNANFRVMERTDLGPLLNEISLAVGMGDPTALQKFKRGKFKSTQWFVKFDVLKAEQVAAASSGIDGGAIGSIIGSVFGGVGGSVSDTAISSVKTGEAAGVWLVGMRYKIIDASTSEQVASKYFEKKMEMGKKARSILGFSGAAEKMITLDTIVQRLVQEAVADIDRRK